MMKRVKWGEEKLVSQDAANQEKVINLHQKPFFIQSLSLVASSDTSCSSLLRSPSHGMARRGACVVPPSSYGTDCYFSALTERSNTLRFALRLCCAALCRTVSQSVGRSAFRLSHAIRSSIIFYSMCVILSGAL